MKTLDHFTVDEIAKFQGVINTTLPYYRRVALAKYLGIEYRYTSLCSLSGSLLEAHGEIYRVLGFFEARNFAKIATQYALTEYPLEGGLYHLVDAEEFSRKPIKLVEFMEKIAANRGRLLSSDGIENEVYIDDVKYYVYRIERKPIIKEGILL